MVDSFVSSYGSARRALDRSLSGALLSVSGLRGASVREERFLAAVNRACSIYYDCVGAILRERFLSGSDGLRAASEHSRLIDILLRSLLRVGFSFYGGGRGLKSGWHFCLVAVGGYGRKELFPYSDVDIVFIWGRRPGRRVLRVINFLLYRLWDLGLRVGHSSGSVEQNLRLARRDHSIATAFLEGRYLGGERAIYSLFHSRFLSEVMLVGGRKFVMSKLDERDERHRRMGDTRYVLEPNLKEGKGALRDLHFIRWIALSFYRFKSVKEFYGSEGLFTASDLRAYERALSFFMALRFHLHYLSGRGSELLTFDVQLTLSERLGYRHSGGHRGVERMMRSYFLHATNLAELTRILTTDLRRRMGSGRSRSVAAVGDFLLDSGVLNVSSLDFFVDLPVRILRLFALGLERDLDFHPNVFRAIRLAYGSIHSLRDDLECYELFLAILTAPSGQERILRTLSESGFLERFLLDFGRVKAQMQYDMYHVYTTDEHTIRAIGNLNRIERGMMLEAHPLASSEIGKISDRRVLYMSVFLHDIAKGQRGDHSILGADLALNLCPRFGFSAAESELVSWLVRYHLLLSDTAFKRNLDDIRTIEEFVSVVGTPDRLRLLLCLTVSDITAVGPSAWNNWKAHLIRVLFRRAMAHMSADLDKAETFADDLRAVQERLYGLLILRDYDESRCRLFLDLGSPSYYLSYSDSELLSHADLVFRGMEEANNFAISMSVDERHAATRLVVYACSRRDLMVRICGAIALCAFNIVEARVNIFSGGMVLHSFTLQNTEGREIFDGSALRRLETTLENHLQDNFTVESIFAGLRAARFRGYSRRTDIFSVEPRVRVLEDASADYTVIELCARDRVGLIFALSETLMRLDLHIGYARIATFGEEAHDVFYVQDFGGKKIADASVLSYICDSLLETLRRDAKGDIEYRNNIDKDIAGVSFDSGSEVN